MEDILKKLVTWASGLNTLNGVYTLSNQQVQEIRELQQSAMTALKPAKQSCTHPTGCTSCNWCGFRAENPCMEVKVAHVTFKRVGVEACIDKLSRDPEIVKTGVWANYRRGDVIFALSRRGNWRQLVVEYYWNGDIPVIAYEDCEKAANNVNFVTPCLVKGLRHAQSMDKMMRDSHSHLP